jgi:hypothetical protein
MKNKIVTRSAFVRDTTADLIENRQAEFVISSEATDGHGTVFKMEGWKLNRYTSNPIVCYQHRSNSDDPDDIIGTSEVFFENDKLIGRVTFEDASVNPKAEKIFQKVISGTLKMASVGAKVNEARLGDETRGENPNTLYFTDQELIEWSIVSAGSNPEAMKRNSETIAEIRSELKPLNIEQNIKQQVKTKTVREAQVIINKNKV